MKKKIIITTMLSLTLLQTNTVISSEKLNHQVVLESLFSNYKNTETNEDFITYNNSIFLSGDNLRNGYTLGYSSSNITGEAGKYDSDQSKLFASARLYNSADNIDGFFSERVDVYYLNTDKSRSIDNIKVVSPQITWTSSDLKRSMNVGYAYSYYSDQQQVHQLTPTVGAKVADNDWLQLRAYLAQVSDSSNTEEDNKMALEIKLTHDFKKANPVGKLNFIQLSTVLGKREFTVDPDTATVYDSGGVQTRSFGLNSKWDLTPSHSIGLSAGNATYESQGEPYNSNYLGANWTYKPSFPEKTRLLQY